MANSKRYKSEEQQELVFEDEVEAVGSLYLSEQADYLLAKETIMNLAYYFYSETTDPTKRIATLFPKAVSLIKEDKYKPAEETFKGLEKELKNVAGDVRKLKFTGIISVYKLLAYEKGYKKGRTKEFMSDITLKEIDAWRVKELVKRTYTFFKNNPNGSFKVNLTNEVFLTNQSMYIDYVHDNIAWDIKLNKNEKYTPNYDEIVSKGNQLNKLNSINTPIKASGIFNVCDDTTHVIQDVIKEEVIDIKQPDEVIQLGEINKDKETEGDNKPVNINNKVLVGMGVAILTIIIYFLMLKK